jgi:hypothetical protein
MHGRQQQTKMMPIDPKKKGVTNVIPSSRSVFVICVGAPWAQENSTKFKRLEFF